MTRHELPPLSALRAFEAAARHASFKAAAAELSVTPTAISHQVRQLEEHLGARVLDRSPRAVVLTPPGHALYDATTTGFAAIARATAAIRRPAARPALTLSATTAFLSQWLLPRLDAIRGFVPDRALRLHTSDDLEQLAPGEIDIAIRYGKGLYAGVESIPLARDVFAPVCSPKLGITKLAELRHAKLLHVDGRRVPRPSPDWARWCEAARASGVDTAAGVRFTDSMPAVQAAIAGHGVAIVSIVLVADALAAGLLVRPFSTTLPGATYHFSCARAIAARADVRALCAWFRRELRTAV